jgi:hypothetical protein
MQDTRNTIIAGLYLAHLVFRIQLNDAESDMRNAELAEFTRALETGDLSQAHYTIVAQALNSVSIKCWWRPAHAGIEKFMRARCIDQCVTTAG